MGLGKAPCYASWRARQRLRSAQPGSPRALPLAIFRKRAQLNPDKDVEGNVQEAVATRRAVLDRFTEITEQLGTVTDDAKLEKLYAEMAHLQDIIDHNNLWELDRQIEVAMSVMNLPPGDADVTKLSWG